MSFIFSGDTHGDFRKFSSQYFPDQKNLTRSDYVIICGDFGGVWLKDKTENYWLDWLEDKPFTTLFVDGNHENYDLLKEYPIEEWNGGKIQRIRPHVIHLMRGQVYEIDGKRLFTMGGAKCHDISDGILEKDDPNFKQKLRQLQLNKAMFRVNHVSWWKEEMPSEEEYNEARLNLEKAGWKVDYIVTHCAPDSIVKVIGNDFYETDELTNFLEEVKGKCDFSHWFFGHYHDDMLIDEKFHLLYEKGIIV